MTTALNFLTNGQTNSPVTLYGNQATSGPAWMQDYTQGLISQANAMASQPYPTYSGSLVAPLNATQNQSFNEVSGLQGQYQGALDQAQGLASSSATPSALTAASGYLPQAQNLTQEALSQTGLGVASPYLSSSVAGTTPGAIQSYLNPYIGDVVNASENMTNTNFTNSVLPQLNSQFIANGQYGSAANERQANLTANQLQEQEQLNAGSILGQGYSTAQSGALGAAGLTEQAGATAGTLGTQAQQAQLAAGQELGALGQVSGGLGYEQGVLGLQGSNQLGSLASEGQNLGLQGASALNAAGNQQQTEAQTSATTAYNQFLQQQQYPEQQASWLQSIMQGASNPYETGSSVQYANQTIPSSSQTSASPLTSALGSYSALTGLGNALGSGSALSQAGTNLGADQSLLNSTLGAGTTNNLGTSLDPNSIYGGSSALSQGNLYTPNIDVGATGSMGLPSYINTPTFYHSGGPVYRARGGALPRVSDNWHVREPTFRGASGQAAKHFDIGGINWNTTTPSDIGGLPSGSSPGIGGINWGVTPPGSDGAMPGYNTSLMSLAGTAQAYPNETATPMPQQTQMPTATAPATSPLTDITQAAGLYNNLSKITGGSGLAGLGAIGSAVGGLGDVLGIANAVEHPSPQSAAGGALDSYKLYNLGNSLAGSGSTGAGALAAADLAEPAPDLASIATPDISTLLGSGADAGTSAAAAPIASTAADAGSGAAATSGLGALGGVAGGLGAIGLAFALGNYLTNADAETPQEDYNNALKSFAPGSFNPSGNSANDAASALNAANEEAALKGEGLSGFEATGGMPGSIGGSQNPRQQVARGGRMRKFRRAA